MLGQLQTLDLDAMRAGSTFGSGER